jgi:hypothetical protein
LERCVEDDCAFVLTRYFIGQAFEPHPITKHERFAQRVLIAERFAYWLWSADFLPQIVRRHVTPGLPWKTARRPFGDHVRMSFSSEMPVQTRR